MWKRFTAGFMVLVMTFVFSGVRGDAAEKQGKTYIKDFKLYIAENSNKVMPYDEKEESKKAKEWFEKNGYKMIEGNLNAGASGTLKKEVGVYLGYSTTTNSDEAVRDIAVMNERGNYSQSEYKRLLEEQKKMYTDMVSDLKEMLEEYRANVNAGVTTAIQARDFMNGYFDDDTGKRLGDLLMEINDDDLGKLLMQANGQAVLMMQDRLSYACDKGKSTWLDRMVKMESYDKLKKQALKACNNDINKANKTLDKKYKADAIILSENWGDVKQHFDNISEQLKNWGLDGKSKDDVEAFFKENEKNPEVQKFHDEFTAISALALYPYEDSSLLEYFYQPEDTFKGDGIRKLYPLVASMTDGQVSGVNQTVSLFTLILNALSGAVTNDVSSGKTAEILDKLPDEDKKEIEETAENAEETVKAWEENAAISIYEGMDREIFDDGVAVTSTALKFSNGDGRNWTDSFVESGAYMYTSIGVGVAALSFCTTGLIMGRIATKHFNNTVVEEFKHISFSARRDIAKYMNTVKKVDEFGNVTLLEAKDVIKKKRLDITAHYTGEDNFLGVKFVEYSKEKQLELGVKGYDVRMYSEKDIAEKIKIYSEYDQQPLEVKNALTEKVRKGENVAAKDALNKYKYYQRLEMGFAIAGIALAVADIVMTSITLYKYYNRDHLPIPSYMVDMSHNDEGETSFVNYRSVHDQNDKYGDVNGGGGKQWLALYQTHDEDAGDPILAPENGEEFDLIVQYGGSDNPKSEDYSPLHMFGAPNTPQNLTFADGESGWSYNDKKNGTYLFFRRGEAEASGEGEAASGSAVSGSFADIGTVVGGSMTVLVGVLCGVAGIFIGVLVMNVRRKKDGEEKQN